MPTKESSVSRVRTGYERMIAHRCSDLYAVTSKDSGEVLAIDDELKICKVRYSNGDIFTFKYGEEYGQCADLVSTQNKALTVKAGDRFEKDEVLAYSTLFFQKDPTSRQVDWKHGVMSKVAIMEVAGTYEDSSIVSHKLGKKLAIEPIQIRSITLTKDSVVHDIVKLHDEVDINDKLLVFEDSDIVDLSSSFKDDEALDYLAKLNRKTPKAKFAGHITKIEMYIGCQPNELHPSLNKLYTALNKEQLALAKQTQDSKNSYEYVANAPLAKGTKFKGVTFDETTVVIRFFIKEAIVAGIGDKIVLDSSLKSVIAKTIDDDITTESGMELDAVFSGTSISNRIVNSPIIVGLSEIVLETLEEDIIDEYFS